MTSSPSTFPIHIIDRIDQASGGGGAFFKRPYVDTETEAELYSRTAMAEVSGDRLPFVRAVIRVHCTRSLYIHNACGALD